MCLHHFRQRPLHLRAKDAESAYLVHHEHLPFDLAELLDISQRDLIRGQQDVHLELLDRWSELVLSGNGARFGATNVRHHMQVRSPRRELRLPGSDGGQRHYDQEGAKLSPLMEEP